MAGKFEAYVSGTGWLCMKGRNEESISHDMWAAVVQLTQEQCREIREFLGPSIDQIVKE